MSMSKINNGPKIITTTRSAPGIGHGSLSSPSEITRAEMKKRLRLFESKIPRLDSSGFSNGRIAVNRKVNMMLNASPMSGAAVGFVETMPMTEPRRSFRMHSIAYSKKIKQSKSLGKTKHRANYLNKMTHFPEKIIPLV